MVALLHVSEIANVLSDRIIAEVEANPGKYLDEEFDRFYWLMIVEKHLREMAETEFTDEAWNTLVDSILDSPQMQMLELTVGKILSQYAADQKEIAAEEKYSYRQRDFI